MATILITGPAGFIGSNLVKYWQKTYPDDYIIGLDNLSIGSNLDNLRGLNRSKFELCIGDITNESLIEGLLRGSERFGKVDGIIHLAAASAVDRSLIDPLEYIKTNVMGTGILLHYANEFDIPKFVYTETDEVVGSAELDSTTPFTEDSMLNPSSPYSASKASGGLLCKAYYKSFAYPVSIIRPTNNFGPGQHTEKLIPRTCLYAVENKPIPVYGKGDQIRDWLYVEDTCRAFDVVYHNGLPGESYIAAGGNCRTNLEILKFILSYLDKPFSLLENVIDRPGHDVRYFVSAAKIKKELNWKPAANFTDKLMKTIDYYKDYFSNVR